MKIKINSHFLIELTVILLYFTTIIFDTIFLIILIQNPNNIIAPIIIPIFTSIIITFSPPLYRFIYKKPNLKFDLEDSRHFLIDIFDTVSSSLDNDETNRITEAVTISPGEEPTEKSKYLRVCLKNEGHQTAKNCSIKMFIHYSDFEMVREPSNLYPAGFHHKKRKRELPPLIDIAAGDFQIFDICSTNNRSFDTKTIRFEDHFSHSRIEAQNNPHFLPGPYYLKLFAYSDNNPPIEEDYKIFLDPSIEGLDWKKINIKKCDWKKVKEKKREEVKKVKGKDGIKKDNSEYLQNGNKTNLNNQKFDYQPNKTNNDYSTGLADE